MASTACADPERYHTIDHTKNKMKGAMTGLGERCIWARVRRISLLMASMLEADFKLILKLMTQVSNLKHLREIA